VSLHHHLPGLIVRAISLARHGTGIFHGAARMIEVGLCRVPGFSRLREKYQYRGTAQRTRKRAKPGRRPLLIHYHIFKNAGLSFEATLKENFGKTYGRYDEIPGSVLSAGDIIRHVTQKKRLIALSSHQLALPPPSIPERDLITSILIRDPIARLRSIYLFERRYGETPISAKARELDFKGYIEWSLANIPSTMCNYQVHFCSRTRAGNRHVVADEVLLRRAIANLDRVDIVGTVERYDDWLALAQVVLEKKLPDIALTVAWENVSERQRPVTNEATILKDLVSDLGPDLADHLLRANELDMTLHQVADSLLTRRLAEHDIEIALRKAYANARQSLVEISDLSAENLP